MRCIMIAVCLAGAMVAGIPCAQGQQLRFVNDYGEPVYLWKFVTKDWEQPPTFFQRDGFGYVDLRRDGKYFLLLQDLLLREREVGWKDLHPIYDINPNAILHVSQLFVVEKGVRTLQWWNCRTKRWEQREIEMTVRVPTGEPVLYVESGGQRYHFDDFINRFKRRPGANK